MYYWKHHWEHRPPPMLIRKALRSNWKPGRHLPPLPAPVAAHPLLVLRALIPQLLLLVRHGLQKQVPGVLFSTNTGPAGLRPSSPPRASSVARAWSAGWNAPRPSSARIASLQTDICQSSLCLMKRVLLQDDTAQTLDSEGNPCAVIRQRAPCHRMRMLPCPYLPRPRSAYAKKKLR